MATFRELKPIRDALDAGDKKTARKLIRPLLAQQPSADLWCLAAQACESDEQAIKALRKSLELEPLHSQANRLLHRLEGAKPGPAPEAGSLVTPGSRLNEDELPPLKKVKYQRQRTVWTYVGCAGSILLSLTAVLIVANFTGSSVVGDVLGFLSGSEPVREIEGTPVEQREDAPLVVTPQQSKDLRAEGTLSDTLSAGYSHEYTFSATSGEELAIMVQFLSPTANGVSRNIIILDPSGANAERECMRDSILQGDNGVVLDCRIQRTGVWRLRIFGREGESTGAYVVSVERFQ
jgi:hypothetical protein